LESSINAAPDDAETIDELTAAFVDVRYAGRTVEPAATERLRKRWEQLRRALASKDAEKSPL
jgi:hypothetical protein